MSKSSIHQRAAEVLPAAGFGNFDPSITIVSGKGSRVTDSNGNEYVDYLIGSGPMLVGHCHPEVIEVVQEQLQRGTTFFANNPQGIELAQEIVASVACAERIRFVSSGGEADMYTMRLARAFTGRKKILKFEGGYHGMSGEALMSLYPTGPQNFPQAYPDSAGIPEAVSAEVLIAPFNDIEATREIIRAHGEQIAAVIVEPLQRVIPPVPGFLEMLREETQQLGIVLIFDEVVTGYRLAYGGAQQHYGVVPDLCALGKIIGGGFPLAAIAGRADIMQHFDKSKVGDAGFTYQVGTLSGNPVAATAGLKTMEILKRDGTYQTLRKNGQRIISALVEHLGKAGIPHHIVGDPVLFDVLFIDREVNNYRDSIAGNAELKNRFNKILREHHILRSPAKFYMSTTLTEADLQQTIDAIKVAARSM